MLKRRTDLALEAAQLWQESAGEAGTLPGVESEEATREGYPVTTVRIRDEAGARALGKPVGTYVTLELDLEKWQKIQCYGKHDSWPGKAVDAFVKRWIEEIVKPTQRTKTA